MTWISLIGLCAAGLSATSFVPQAIQTIRTRQTDGISLPTYLMLCTALLLWLLYGLLKGDVVIIIANCITLPFAAAILATKIQQDWKHGRWKRKTGTMGAEH